MTTDLYVKELWTYPIKSCAGMRVERSEIATTGLVNDRRWAVVHDDGRAVSQYDCPKMAKVVPVLSDGVLTLTAPGMPSLSFGASDVSSERVDVLVWTYEPTKSLVCSDETSGWFSDFLGFSARLVQVEVPRPIKSRYYRAGSPNQVGLADRFSLHITSSASLASLNEHLVAPVPMTRFRPNIVIAGDALAPYEEDEWREIRIGLLTAHVVRACGRCPVVDTDQSTGERRRAVRKALGAKRTSIDLTDPDRKGGLHFGQYLVHEMSAPSVAVGERLEVISRADAPNVLLEH